MEEELQQKIEKRLEQLMKIKKEMEVRYAELNGMIIENKTILELLK